MVSSLKTSETLDGLWYNFNGAREEKCHDIDREDRGTDPIGGVEVVE